MRIYRQTHMFPAGEDLPLFSGIAPRCTSPFRVLPEIAEADQRSQSPLFPLPEPEVERFKCPNCGYECNWDELGGEYDCPLCGDN